MAGNSDPQLIDAIAAAIAGALAAHGVKPDAGNETVFAACAALCHDFGGEEYWLPKTYRTGRDRKVVQAIADGKPVQEAARAVGIHPDTARRIVKRQSSGIGRDDWVL